MLLSGSTILLPLLQNDWRRVVGSFLNNISPSNMFPTIPPEACEKVASDLELGRGFRRLLQFPPPVSTG